MNLSKSEKIFNEENYIHCSICGDYSNINSYAHRKSADHQMKLTKKMSKILFHLSKKKKQSVVIHDADWPQKDIKQFCHFCVDQYPEHHSEGEFVIENLGSLYHYSSSHHIKLVRTFLKKNDRKEKAEKFCILSKDLDNFLKKIPYSKEKYLKKMAFIDKLALKQMKDSEEERKKIFDVEMQIPSTSVKGIESTSSGNEISQLQTMSKFVENQDDVKLPPWLDNISSVSSEQQSTSSVIGPTMDTLKKHMVNQKKKGLSKSRVGANFKSSGPFSSKWLPSFQGVWNQGCRKHLRTQFKHRNKK